MKINTQKNLITVLPYNCLYLNKGNNSSVKGSILTKLIGYREFMVLIICTKNELNLTNRYWDMVLDGMGGRTHGRRQNYIPPTSLGDNIPASLCSWSCLSLNWSETSKTVVISILRPYYSATYKVLWIPCILTLVMLNISMYYTPAKIYIGDHTWVLMFYWIY